MHTESKKEPQAASWPGLLPVWARSGAGSPLRDLARSLVCGLVDLKNRVFPHVEPVPPSRMRVRVGCFLSFIHRDRYLAVGREAAGYFCELGGIGERSRVLDVGCGCGQVAVPLLEVIGPEGRYVGMDIDERAIAWCRENITPRHSGFGFQTVDVRNSYYNPDGDAEAQEYTFPFDADTFDVVILKSVFTHMQPPEVRRYLAEIGRVLKPGGRVVATYYVLNDTVRGAIRRKEAAYDFPHQGEDYRTIAAEVPEYTIGFEEDLIREWHEAAGMRVEPPLHAGSWSGANDAYSFQDIVVGIKG